jgi:hypothetical protein
MYVKQKWGRVKSEGWKKERKKGYPWSDLSASAAMKCFQGLPVPV